MVAQEEARQQSPATAAESANAAIEAAQDALSQETELDSPPPAAHRAPPQPLIVEPKIQWALATRTMVHWVACVTYFAVVLFFSQLMYDPEQSLLEHIKSYAFDALHWMPAILLLLPLVVYDTLRVSQRILCPVLRVRDGLEGILKGQPADITLDTCADEYFPELTASYLKVAQLVDRVDGIEMSDEEADAELDALLG